MTDISRSLPARLADYFLLHRFSILFASLLLTLIVLPVSTEFQVGSGSFEILLFINLAAAAVGSESRLGRTRLLVFIAATASLRLIGRSSGLAELSAAAGIFWVCLMALAAYRSLRFALRGRRIDSEHVSAALSAYLLAGLFFGAAYWQIDLARPGSLAAAASAGPADMDLQAHVYFSFVTLATLGYGDIIPATPTTRGLAVVEAILGQLYLAVLVARLVGTSSSNRSSAE